MRTGSAMGKLSIIIPTYNSAHFLPETLESILNQDYEDYELIVVDDGSTDNTRELIQSYGVRITYLHQENSGGCSMPRNVGIRYASGEYIAIFDADDIMKPGKIMLQSDFLNNNPHVGFVFTDFCDFRGAEILRNHISTCPIFNQLRKKKVRKNEYIINSTDAYETLLMENFIGASSMMFRKSVYEEIGPFDEHLESSEDIDFTLRVARKYDFGFIDRLGHLRRLHDGNMTNKNEKMIKAQIRVYSDQLQVKKSFKSQNDLVSKIAMLYCSLGYFYRENGMMGEACKSYLSSIRVKKDNNRAYLGLLKAALLSLWNRDKKLCVG